MDCSYIRPKLRVNDVCIMDLAIKMDFTDNQRNRINAVREWYNVMYLSEITNENGRSIMDGVLLGTNPIQKYRRRSDGPKQKKPNTYSFKFWQKLFQPLLLNGCGNQLKQELGNWTKNHSKCGEWAVYQCEIMYTSKENTTSSNLGDYIHNSLENNLFLNTRYLMSHSIRQKQPQSRSNHFRMGINSVI